MSELCLENNAEGFLKKKEKKRKKKRHFKFKGIMLVQDEPPESV